MGSKKWWEIGMEKFDKRNNRDGGGGEEGGGK